MSSWTQVEAACSTIYTLETRIAEILTIVAESGNDYVATIYINGFEFSGPVEAHREIPASDGLIRTYDEFHTFQISRLVTVNQTINCNHKKFNVLICEVTGQIEKSKSPVQKKSLRGLFVQTKSSNTGGNLFWDCFVQTQSFYCRGRCL